MDMIPSPPRMVQRLSKLYPDPNVLSQLGTNLPMSMSLRMMSMSLGMLLARE